MALPNFSKAQIRSAYTWFNYHVYKGHKPVWHILTQVALVKITSSPMVNSLFKNLSTLWHRGRFVKKNDSKNTLIPNKQ